MKRIVLAATLAMLVSPALSGPLDPPAGPVSPTMKTLDLVEPRRPLTVENAPGNGSYFFVINQPGSYYLTSPLIVTGDTGAIQISAPDVTIDLNGFWIAHSGGPSTRPMITVDASNFSNTTIRNGTLRDPGNHGLVLGRNARVEGVTVRNAQGDGINVGARSIVSNCFVENPNSRGIVVSTHSRVIDSMVSDASSQGIETSTHCKVLRSTVNQCSQSGISIAFGTLVQECNVVSNTGIGISGQLNSGSLRIINNVVTGNGSGGIRVYHSSYVAENHISSSGLAVPCILVVEDGSRIEANHCNGGPDAVRIDASGIDNLVIGNFSRDATVGNGFANVNLANNQIGPIVTSGGTIASTSPFANFSR